MAGTEPDAAEIVRLRLQVDLRATIKRQDMFEAAVLRRLVAAVDNAGAVPIAPRSGPRRHEVERRHLDRAEVQALLQEERDACLAAAEAFSRLGLGVEAEAARLEAAVVGRYLAAPPPTPPPAAAAPRP